MHVVGMLHYSTLRLQPRSNAGFAPSSVAPRVHSNSLRSSNFPYHTFIIMADPFSLATGIAGLISLAEMAIRLGYGFYADIKGFPTEYQSLLTEISSLFGVLGTLKVVLDCPGRTSTLSSRKQALFT
jgi:hypothetical protein